MVRRAAGGLLVIAAWLAAPGRAVAEAESPAAAPSCETITRTLAADAEQARLWNVGWGVTFAGAALGQASLAASLGDDIVDDATRAGLYVGAVKASIGVVARVVLPLRIPQPTSCDDAAAALAAARKKQRNGFWLNAIGGLVVNAGGTLYLGLVEDSWETAASSFAVGMAVSILSGYTAPRRAWRGTFVVAPAPGGLSLVATF